MPDRSTRIMQNYSERINKTLQGIEDHPGISSNQVCALLSLQLKVKRETVEGYVRTLGDARLIVADMGNLWTAKAYENRSEAMHKQQEAEEEMMMQKARVARTSPLEAYDTESRD